ncbi:MAG: hypothetical protein Q8Q09_13705 [Deltaproteobacteria bacterium]|nr:hypothetical protein [Deltaproteobacteria bacterium]
MSRNSETSCARSTLGAVCTLTLLALVARGANGSIVRPAGRPPKPPLQTPAPRAPVVVVPTDWRVVNQPNVVETPAVPAVAESAQEPVTLDALERRSERAMCDRWLTAQTPTAPADWAPRADATCAIPTVHPAATADARRLLDAFRWLSGAAPIAIDPASAGAVDACAVMMDRADRLDHHPDPSWPCYSPAGAQGASSSNLTLISPGYDATSGVESFINERVESLGHRRWLLFPRLAPTAIGLTARAMCIHARTAQGPSAPSPEVVAYPNPGFAPISNFRTGIWSVHDGTRDVRGATARVVEESTGTELAITQRALDGGYGGAAITFSPAGWTPQVGVAYRVTLSLAATRTQAAQTVSWRTLPTRCGGGRSGSASEPRGWRPASPLGATELAPEASIPSASGLYVSWSTDDQGSVTRTLTTVVSREGQTSFREERSVRFRAGGGSTSTRQWTAQPYETSRAPALLMGGGMSIQ